MQNGHELRSQTGLCMRMASSCVYARAVGLQIDCMVALPAPVVRLPDSHVPGRRRLLEWSA